MAQIRDLVRMCKSYPGCDGCPFDGDCALDSLPDNADEVVDNWAKEHPRKRYVDDIMEKFPNVEKNDSGLPIVCIHRLYGKEVSNCVENNCWECWTKEMKEEI